MLSFPFSKTDLSLVLPRRAASRRFPFLLLVTAGLLSEFDVRLLRTGALRFCYQENFQPAFTLLTAETSSLVFACPEGRG